MTPEEFIALWKNNPLTERAGAQAWFDDLCELLGVAKPRDPDNYCFERGAGKSGGGDGWADVWMRGRFGWENKKPGRDLPAALKQLTDYFLQLDNPPLLVVADRERIVIHTAFTGYPDQPREIRIEQLADPQVRQILRWVFTDPEKLRPEKSTAAITAQAAGHFADLAAAMRGRGQDGQRVAHFLVQCLFCMFAEDEAVLPAGIFTDLLAHARGDTGKAARRIATLFAAMQSPGGEYGDHDIPWFNGGLFSAIDIPALTAADLAALHRAAADMDWRAIDPTIFGTLFERGLDPAARAPLGAHYTDTETIAKLIDPLIREPLLAEWDVVKAEMRAKPRKARALHQGFLLRLDRFRVLDPACGSGNFLYLALAALRDVEKRAHVDAQELGLGAELVMHTGPHNILGLEINEFAAELARVTVWIGDIQWCRRNGYPHAVNPILKPLDGIEHRDALLNPDGSEAEWPAADVITGNPPFLGGTKKRGELGDAYFEALANCYGRRVPPGADLVCYWFEKSRAQIEAKKLQAAGLVATNSIRQQANRKVLDRIVETTRIFEAWSDEPWVNEGAAVRVSLVGFGPFFGVDRSARLDGIRVQNIYSDLRTGNNLTSAKKLHENAGASFFGVALAGNFTVDQCTAEKWFSLPNPNGRPNADVVRPLWNGMDLTSRWEGRWVIDFGPSMGEMEASLFEAPFYHVLNEVKPVRLTNNRRARAEKWWRHGEARPAMRGALAGLNRYIATSEKSKHRFFVWMHRGITADNRLIVIARNDDATFGILSSRIHVVWALAVGSTLEDRPAYATNTCFETFPFPAGLTPRDTPRRRPVEVPRRAWLARSSPPTSPPPPAASTNCAKPGSTRPNGSTGSSPRKRKKPASPNARLPNPATKPT
jgi:type II restriction/modification system DNA methylase subunit YeeA